LRQARRTAKTGGHGLEATYIDIALADHAEAGEGEQGRQVFTVGDDLRVAACSRMSLYSFGLPQPNRVEPVYTAEAFMAFLQKRGRPARVARSQGNDAPWPTLSRKFASSKD
jgi:hypothetical protein